MTGRLSEREKLIKRINEAMFRDEDKGCVKPSEIADWHLAEVKRIVEPLNKLGDISNLHNQNYQQDIDKAIELTLMRAGGE